ncbi:MAG: proline iminopeptidase-family hydrolase [Saprospiraceae bacterium]
MPHKLLLLVIILISFECKRQVCNNNIKEYFAPKESGLQNGNVKEIVIKSYDHEFKVWTKTIGNNPSTRILLLSGGPGCSHEYFECCESFLPAEGIEFIYYDQLGTGYSDNPKDTVYWNLERYVEEVEQVRKALKLDHTNFYLLGHSWGGILAMEYASKYQSNLKALIISDMMASCPKYGQYAKEVLAKKLDPKILDSIKSIESRKDFSNPKYMELLMPNFYNQFICRIPLKDWPEPMKRSFDKINNSLYVTMQGPSEFGIGGNLIHWDRSEDLKNYNIPTLIIGAHYDTMDPLYMEWMSKQIKRSNFLLCKNGSHMCMWDDQEAYFGGLIQFIKTVESKKI